MSGDEQKPRQRRGVARQSRPSASTPRTAAGRIIAVVGDATSGHAVLVAALRRRFAGDPRLVFPVRVTTAASEDSHLRVDRRTFEAMRRDGSLMATWRDGGVEEGLRSDHSAMLDDGRWIVIAVPPAALPALARASVRVDRIDVEARSHILGRRAAIGRGAAQAGHDRAPRAPRQRHVSRLGQVATAGDFATGLRALAAILDAALRVTAARADGAHAKRAPANERGRRDRPRDVVTASAGA
ncbi:MAG: hypothetical protein NW205_03470 [Hyphomicrobiaceae bacterium]|nr:hypothetical protein [Hyphomicrobiaceae bacterium]